MREVEHDPRNRAYDKPTIQGVPIRDFRYADDTTLLATTTRGLEDLRRSVKEHSEQKGLHLNVKKTEIMDTDKCKMEAVIKLDVEEIEWVNSFEYFGARIEANGKSSPEIRRRLAMATSKLKKMASIWKGHSIDAKVRILKCIIFPIATYGCEAWSINNTDSKKITSFEMNCYRKMWTQKVSNEEVLLKIGIVSPSLLQNVKN